MSNQTRVIAMSYTTRTEYRETVMCDPTGKPYAGEASRAIARLADFMRGHAYVDPASVEFYWLDETTSASADGCAMAVKL